MYATQVCDRWTCPRLPSRAAIGSIEDRRAPDGKPVIGIKEIEIGAAMSNPRAVALYRRLGFEDSHTMMLNLGKGKEKVLFLRLVLHPQPLPEA